MKDTPIIMAKDALASELLDGVKIAKLKRGQKFPYDHNTGEKIRYLDIVTSWDIETSTDMIKRKGKESRHSWVYLWCWQFGDRYTVVGRTLDEFVAFAASIMVHLQSIGNDVRLMCYVHRLEYEFVYLSGVWNFDTLDVFATDKRKVLYCLMGNIEMRCSYRLSNYSLETWCKEFPNDHTKGTLDYKVVRYPWDELPQEVIAYCQTDVICVVERVQMLMQMHGDNLYSIPYTTTGYVRREVKRAVHMWSYEGIHEMQDDLSTYKRLLQAYRGGDGYASRYWVDDIVGDVYSYDISSSYPAIMCHCMFPMTKFREEEDCTIARFQFLLDMGRAVLFKVAFKNICIKDKKCPNPYIALDKCRQPGFRFPEKVCMDDKHVLSANYLEMAITDLDFEIIQSQYDWEGDIKIEWMMSARYGYLPQPVTEIIINLYKEKTRLAEHEEFTARYNHTKVLCNSISGLFGQRTIQNPIIYDDGKWKIDTDFDEVAEYDKAIKRAFVRYAWGCWCYSWGRYRLWKAIEIANNAWGSDTVRYPFIYADTDSIMCACELDFKDYNKPRIVEAKATGAFEKDTQGKVHYMGVMEYKWKADLFRTLGLKKYVTVIDGKLTIAVSGLNKKQGSDILRLDGGIEAFIPGYSFVGVDNPVPDYNDRDDFTVKIGKNRLHITRNVVIMNMPFEMELNRNYLALVHECKGIIDKEKYPHYNAK